MTNECSATWLVENGHVVYVGFTGNVDALTLVDGASRNQAKSA